MTKIQKLLIRGFKSFATKTEIIFGDDFNVVLGPNGSGKSNVLDALIFVLGKGSAKGLRAEKSENLIYNGGKTKTPAKEAEVALFLDNSKGVFPTEEQTVKISRILRQNGQSKYRINDKNRTRQQILELLAAARIDPDGYNIILQGDITHFVEMNPEHRREIIEEIAGIGFYQERREKALRELEKVELRLNDAELVLKERKTRLDEIRKDRNQAQKYKELEERRDSNKATLLHSQISRKKEREKGFQSMSDKQKKRIDAIHREVLAVRKKMEEKKAGLQAISDEIEAKGEKEQVELHRKVEAIKVELATHRTRVHFIGGEIRKVEQKKEQLEKSLSEANAKAKSIVEEERALRRRVEEKQKELRAIEKKIAAFRKDHNLDAAGKIEQEIELLDKTADEKQREIEELRLRQQELMREKDRLELQIESIDEKIYKVRELEKEHKAELEKLKAMKTQFKNMTLDLQKLLAEDGNLAAQLTTGRQRLQSAEQELAKLRSQSAGLRGALAATEAISKLVANKARFRGVHDLVSSLGSVSSKYAQALEVAAGPRLRSLVVETDAVAASCIKYLKQNRLGIVTFLPLNKIKGAAPDAKAAGLKKEDGVLGLALDLIKYDAKYKNVFSYVFGNTLVVDTIATARRIGIGTARMVTLDGDMCELSGAITGGFRQKAKGAGFQEKELTDRVRALEQEVANHEALISSLERRKQESEKHVGTLRVEKANLEGEVIKLEKSLHLDTADLDSSKQVKKDFEKSLADADKKIAEIQEKITQANQELTKAKIRKQEHRSQVADIRSPTKLAELNAFEQKRSEFKEELIHLEARIQSVVTNRETIFGPEEQKIQKMIRQQEKEGQEFVDEQKAVAAKIQEHEAELTKLEVEEKKFYAQFKGLFNRRNTLSDEMQNLEKDSFRKEEHIRELEEKMNATSMEMARVSAELAALEEEFKPYRSRPLLKDADEETLRKELAEFERMVANFGAVNMRALEIYDSVLKEYETLVEKRKKLLVEKEDVLVMINEIEAKKTELFTRTFEVVNGHFKSFFALLTTKGDASLLLENPQSPFEAGVLIKVRISSKKYLDIRSLSGGEKTLTALAFIFAIQEHDPASFYVLDEVDAALDKRNSEKLAKLVRKYCTRAQYIIISHNDGVISEADRLYGVSMNEHGMTKITTLKV